MAGFDRFVVLKEIPKSSTLKFICAYAELNEEAFILCRAQRLEGATWVDLPNRIAFTLELAPDIIEGLMEAAAFDPASLADESIDDAEIIENG